MLLRDFLAAQHWVLSTEIHPRHTGGAAKRQRPSEEVLFTGLACFFDRRGRPCALVLDAAQADWLTLTCALVEREGGLVMRCDDEQRAVECCIDHGAVKFIKVARNRGHKRPPWIGLDFGTVELRLWQPNHEDMSFSFLLALCSRLPRARDPPLVETSQFLNSHSIFALIQRASEDRKNLRDALGLFVKSLAVAKESATFP